MPTPVPRGVVTVITEAPPQGAGRRCSRPLRLLSRALGDAGGRGGGRSPPRISLRPAAGFQSLLDFLPEGPKSRLDFGPEVCEFF